MSGLSGLTTFFTALSCLQILRFPSLLLFLL
jgi:hypothetical protein